MKTETLASRDADAAWRRWPETLRRPPVAATGRSSHARKTLWLLALAFMVHGSAAFAQTTPSPSVNEKIVGVGVVLLTQGGDFVVGELVPNAPAEASKLIHNGDRILGVAEGEGPTQFFAGKPLSDCVALIRGKAGSALRLTVISEGGEARDAREVLLTREPIHLQPARFTDDDAVKPEAPAVDPTARGLAFEHLSGGETDQLSNYRGKIVVLEFWATWCAPCQGAMAELQRTAAQSNDLRGKVAFITVSIDRGKEAPAARLKEAGWTDTLNGWAPREALAPWQIYGLPMTCVIDADGKIVAGNSRMTRQTLEDLVKVLWKN